MPYPPQGVAAGVGVTSGVKIVQYTGNNSGGGETQSVTGVGFEPDLIIIHADGTLDPYCGPRWVIGPDDVTGCVMGGSDNQWNAISEGSSISIDSDGFSLIDEANANNYLYTAICFKIL